MKTKFMLLLALAISLSVKAANPTCGLTIITHGFETGTFPGWPLQMARAITNKIGAAIPIYRVKFNFNHLTLSGYVSLEDGATTIDFTQTGGAIVLLDWSDVSWDVPITAQNVADSFYNYLFAQTFNGHSLTEIPIHLIGHSRGCSLNARLAYVLAQNGILIDQVTTLDPHPVTANLFPDWTPETYFNILFADNYWQSHVWSFPDGMPIPGTFDQDLSDVVIQLGDLPDDPHTRVHTYYYGTIDTSFGNDGDGNYPNINWYINTRSQDLTGYNFSRYLNPTVSRPSNGIGQNFYGLGGNGSRVSLNSLNITLWPNAGFDQRSNIPDHVTVGQTVTIPYYYGDWAYHETVTFSLDADTNPFNGVEHDIASVNQNVISAGAIATTSFSWMPTASDLGTHYIRIQATDSGGRTRYDYFFKPVMVQAASITAPVVNTVSPSIFTGLPIGQTKLIRVIGSGFTASSTLTFNDGVNPSYTGRVPTAWSANELDYNISTGTNQANWTVQVFNGAQTSNLGHFTVNAPSAPPALTGSLVVNLSPAGAISAGAQWQVDGTGYNSSGQVVGYLTPGSHTVSFKPISGYATPANQIVTINANAQTPTSGTYFLVLPSTYTLTLNQGGSAGYIVNQPFGSGSGNIYSAGAVVQLTANANFGYHFVNWSGDVSGTANPTTITMNGNKSATANFATGDPNLGTITVTIQPPEAAAAGVTWGFNDSDFRASGATYSYYPETVWVELHNTNGWVGVGGWVTFTAGVTTNYTFAASSTNGSIIGNDPRTYFTLAGLATNYGSADGTGSAALFNSPWSLAVDKSGNIFVADTGNNTIRKVSPLGVVTTVAGQVGVSGSTDGQGTNASFNYPSGIAVDQSNNLYISEFFNSTIRKITPDGIVSTFAGLAGNNDSVDANGTAARFYFPAGVAVDTNGNVYVSDSVNETIRKITPNGDVSTLAGLARTYGTADGTGSTARFHNPIGLTVDSSGNVYVADEASATVRKITPAGVVTTLAGFPGSAGTADGTGNAARFQYLSDVAAGADGNVYVADTGNHAIRKITQAGVVTTLAGQSGNPGSADGIGSVVRFNNPGGVAVDATGNLFVADHGNSTIRATRSLTAPVDQYIAFAPLPDKSVGDAPLALSATASSGLPVYLNVVSGPAVLDTNNVLTLLGGGAVSVIAWQPGNSNYNAATPVLQSFNVGKIPQTITFGPLSQQKLGDAPFSVYASSDSGLPVDFSVTGPAVLTGNILTLTDWGTVTVTASQPGNASYMVATNVVQSFTVVPPNNTIVAPEKLPNGDFRLAFYGLNGSNYLVQASTNMIDWEPLTNFTGTNFLLYFDDSSATNMKQRFYRVVRP
jgi:Divergent InlB B-repeat domain/NHL repeat